MLDKMKNHEDSQALSRESVQSPSGFQNPTIQYYPIAWLIRSEYTWHGFEQEFELEKN